MFENGFFGSTFDFYDNGQLDELELAVDFNAFISITEDENNQTEYDDLES